MNACKSMRPPLQKEDDLKRWMSILASELYTRVHDEFDETSRWPKTFSLHHSILGEGKERTRSCPFPRRHLVTTPDVLIDTGLGLLCENRLPCSRLAIGAQALIKVLEIEYSMVMLVFSRIISNMK